MAKDIMFVAVKVNRGRKFRGDAYLIEGGYTYERGYHGSGVDPYQRVNYSKIWVPAAKDFCFVREAFVEAREVSEEVLAKDKAAYVDYLIENTVKWCRAHSVGKAEQEVLRFAYNVLRKYNPQAIPAFETKYGFKVDVASVVKSTVDWAFGLGYRADKAARIAFRALVKKGLAMNPEFNEPWCLNLAAHGAEKYACQEFMAA